MKVPHQELDKNVDNLEGLIGVAAERNSMAFASIKLSLCLTYLVELKPKVDERMEKLEALRKRVKDQEKSHALYNLIEQLSKQHTEFKLMEKSLRKKCDILEKEYEKEITRNKEGKANMREKKATLTASNIFIA